MSLNRCCRSISLIRPQRRTRYLEKRVSTWMIHRKLYPRLAEVIDKLPVLLFLASRTKRRTVVVIVPPPFVDPSPPLFSRIAFLVRGLRCRIRNPSSARNTSVNVHTTAAANAGSACAERGALVLFV